MKRIAFLAIGGAFFLSACDITVEQMTPEDSRVYRETKLVKEEIFGYNERASNTIEDRMTEICGAAHSILRMDHPDLDKDLAEMISCRKEFFSDVREERREDPERLKDLRAALLTKAAPYNLEHWVDDLPSVSDEVGRYRRMNDRLQDRLLMVIRERKTMRPVAS